jgi:hypothetical protein
MFGENCGIFFVKDRRFVSALDCDVIDHVLPDLHFDSGFEVWDSGHLIVRV